MSHCNERRDVQVVVEHHPVEGGNGGKCVAQRMPPLVQKCRWPAPHRLVPSQEVPQCAGGPEDRVLEHTAKWR